MSSDEDAPHRDKVLFEKIKLINEGTWTISQDSFSVFIADRQIYQDELFSIDTQISISNISDNDIEVCQKFREDISKVQSCQDFLRYSASQNIINLETIEDLDMEDLNDLIFSIDFKPIYENCLKADYLSDFVSPSDFTKIGEIIQTDADSYNKLKNYMISISGQIISQNDYDDFIINLPIDSIFDSYKLGLSFCEFLYQQHSINIDSKIDSILNSQDENCRSFPLRISRTFSEKNILFIKVQRPVHCYHCIISIDKIISSINNSGPIFNRKTLIFCEKNGNFLDNIKNIPKNRPELTYFIVHPEVLNEKDHSILIEFINERMKFYDDKKMTKIIIVSSKSYRESCSLHIEKIGHCEFTIDDRLIEHLCDLSLADPSQYSYQLYYSEKSGMGKSTKIREDFEKDQNCIQKHHFLKRIFIDANTKFIPSFKRNNEIYEYVHFDLSPEIFEENFLIFDKIWSFAVLHSHVYPGGASDKTPSNLFFEIPSLNDNDNLIKEGVFQKAEFPICLHYPAHQISVSENCDEIKISEGVKHFCDRLFNQNIILTSELIKQAAELFYPSFKLKKSWIEPRLLNQVNSFMNYFCQFLSQDDETDEYLAIFLLLLRTNFHIWKMETIFEKKIEFNSFIIFVPQNLFSSQIGDNLRWTLLSFFSQDVKCKKWKIDCLDEEFSDKIQSVIDSKLLENDFFSFLNDREDVDVYSNEFYYDNDQSNFFNIIRSIFYQNNDNRTYTELADGVLLRKLEQNPNYDDLNNLWPLICDGKDIYNEDTSSKPKWNPVFDRLHAIHERKKEELINLVNDAQIVSNKNVNEIKNIVLTMDIVKRFVIMMIRIVLNQTVIFEGSTGVGKTKVMRIFEIMVNSAMTANKSDFNWVYHQIECNNNLTIEKFEDLRKSFYENVRNNPNQIIFLDHFNTSPIMDYIVNEINQSHIEEDNQFSTIFIAAVNPYVKFTESSQSLPLVGFKHSVQEKSFNPKLYSLLPNENDLSNLVYNVKKLPDSTQIYIVDSDPKNFIYKDDKDNLEYLSSEEIYVNSNIISFSLDSLIDQLYKLIKHIEQSEQSEQKKNKTKKGTKKKKQEDEKLFKINTDDKDTIYTIVNSILEYKDDIINAILPLINTAFNEIRDLIKFKSIFTYRDVKQFMALFTNFFRKLINLVLEQENSITTDDLNDNIIPYSIVLTIMLSIVFRFSGQTNIEINDKNFIQLKKFGMESLIDIRSGLIKLLSDVDWGKNIQKPEDDWNQIVKSYSWLKCMKYIYPTENDTKYNAQLLKTESLINNLFAISSCYSASKNNPDCVLPCSIIGPSGSSKKFALQLFVKYKESKSSKLFTTTYLYTKQSTENSLSAKYKDCASFMMNNKDSLSICSIENLSIDNMKDKSSIQALHRFMEQGIEMISAENDSINIQVMPFITTSYSLDYATMNRSILIYNEMPSDSDLSKAFYISELESIKEIYTEEKKNDLLENFFYENNFFNIDKENGVHKEKYKKFLSKLWKLTKDKKRPEVFSLQPIYLIFNSLFHNNKGASRETINNLIIYINSIPEFDVKNSYYTVEQLLSKLDENPYIKKDDNDNNIVHELYSMISDNSKVYMNLFEEIFNGNSKSIIFNEFCDLIKDKKTKIIKALNTIIESKKNPFAAIKKEFQKHEGEIYTAFEKAAKSKSNSCFEDLLDFIDINYIVLRQLIINAINQKRSSMCIKTQNYECLDFIEYLIQNITDKYSKNKENEFYKIFSNNQSMENILKIIQESNNNLNKIHYIFIIGKFNFSDSFLHFFNLSENKIIDPILCVNGFTIQIDQIPKNIVFCFIENENNNSDPILNNLNSIYLDYESKDDFDIINGYNKFYSNQLIKSTPHATIAHEYCNHFVPKLNDIDVPNEEEEKEFAVVFAVRDKKLSKKYEIDNVSFDKKLIILTIDKNTSDFDEIKNNIETIKNEESSNDYIINYYWTDDFYNLYNDNKIGERVQIPKPEPINYEYVKNDGSINILFEKNLVDSSEQFKSIILTTSPISEEINYESKSDMNIVEDNSIILYDSFFNESSDLDEKIDLIDKNDEIKYIIVRLNKFDKDFDRYIRNILSTNALTINIIIIYHLEKSKIPEGLCTSNEWPILWIESITKSSFSSFTTADVMNCVLFDEEENKPIYHKVIEQIFNDINKKYEKHINDEKTSDIIQYIFDLFNDKNMFKKSIFNNSNFIKKLKGKSNNKFYEQINIKRSFINEIEEKYPVLENLIEILVIGFDLVNKNDIDDTKSFINKIIDMKNFNDLFEKSKIKELNYPQLENTGIYFPELILPQVLTVYKNFIDGLKDCPKELKSSIKTFLDLQPNQDKYTIETFYNGYFRQYLIENSFNTNDDFIHILK